jgi:phosphatidylglycerophosphate synthase
LGSPTGTPPAVALVAAVLTAGTARVTARWALVIAAVTAAALALVAEQIPAAGWTLLGGTATALLVLCSRRLFRAPGGTSLTAPGPANVLTIARLVWTAPLASLLAGGEYGLALGLYVLLALSDVLDGIVARGRRQTSAFGVIMDPVADVLSTLAVFTVFMVDNLVPLWLYLLLAARYAMLLAGSAILTLAVGPITYRATPVGKGVGVVQAAGAGLIVWGARTGGLEPGRAGAIFAVLGLGFASVIVSQGCIGWRHIRNPSRGRTVQRGSSR